MFNRDDLAGLARTLREAAGMTQQQVADLIGTSQPMVAMAETQVERPYVQLRIDIIERLSDFDVEGPLYRLRRKRQ